MDTNNLQQLLDALTQASSQDNIAYNMLLSDYTRYHAVLAIEGSLFVILFMVSGQYCWRRLTQTNHAATQAWTFEKKSYLGLMLVSVMVVLGLLLLVAANLSNVLNPQAGFAKTIPELGTPSAGTYRATLYQAVAAWVHSDNGPMPALLRDAVQNRLEWQLPKAIICSGLTVVLGLFTTSIWRSLLHHHTQTALTSRKGQVLTILAVLAVPVTLLLMLMALANTQASFAPVMITLLFS